MKHLDLFSGIGGFAVAAKWAGMETVGFCEINEYCRKVLKKHWPTVPIVKNIKELKNNGQFGTIDIISGGFPCQPFSCAGERRGKEDDRYIWPEMLRVIQEFEPAWVIAENVVGIESVFQYSSFSELESEEYHSREDAEADFRGISERVGRGSLFLVMEGLEKIGYEVEAHEIPACAVSAPHQRKRVWIVANTRKPKSRRVSNAPREEIFPVGGISEIMADSNGQRSQGRDSEKLYECSSKRDAGESCTSNGTHTESIRLARRESQNDPKYQSENKQIRKKGRGETEPYLRQWEIEPDVGRVANGIPSRVDRLKGLGNAIVPQVAYQIMKKITQCLIS